MASSRFSYSGRPMIRHSRSQFDLSRRHLTTINMGDLVPIYWEEVLPGDTIKGHMKEVVRTTTPFIKPIMDNLFIDTYFFFVPNRLVMNDWAKVIGDDSGKSAWSAPDLKEVPSVGFDASVSSGIAPQSLADYFGIPTGISSSQLQNVGDISSLLFRGYALIYNEWFRDENNEDPVLIQLGDASNSSAENINNQPFGPSNYTGMCAKVNKVHDRFTSALPAPQKGQSVSIGSVVFPESLFPVASYPLRSGSQSTIAMTPTRSRAISLLNKDGYQVANYFSENTIQFIPAGSQVIANVPGTTNSGTSFLNLGIGGVNSPTDASFLSADTSVSSRTSSNDVSFANLFTYVPETSLESVDINDLRLAFQTQRYLERDAVGGSRYIEFLRSHFGVVAGDARLQRPEYLGGKRTPIAIYQENQTSAPTEDSPLGQVAGWSLTSSDSGFNKAFVEHGYIIGLACVRQFHTYQQGIHPSFFRHSRYDYYDPVFAHIGEQPVYTRELYVGSSVSSDQVFGYQEAWSEYRQGMNRVSGYMRSSAPESLDIWHLADQYSSVPVLGQQFLQESSANLDRVLTVGSVDDQGDPTNVPNFLFDTYIDVKAIRVMPTYSIPGLIDHD